MEAKGLPDNRMLNIIDIFNPLETGILEEIIVGKGAIDRYVDVSVDCR